MAKPSVADLRAAARGEVITADDAGYDAARRVYNAMIDRRPRVVARPTSAADVMAAVGFARDNGLDLSVRGGSHSVPGFGTNDGGVVVDLSRMRGVRVAPRARTVRAEGGATWGDVFHATYPFGGATTGGIISTTGVGGRSAAASATSRAGTACRSTTCSRRTWSSPTGASVSRARRRTRTSSGPSAGAAGTSASSPPSSSSCSP